MGIIKKSKFESKIPVKYQQLSINTITDELMYEIIQNHPEIQIPKFIDRELEKGNITKNKAEELKRRATVNGIKDYIKKEKEEFERSKSISNKLKSIKNEYKIKPKNIQK